MLSLYGRCYVLRAVLQQLFALELIRDVILLKGVCRREKCLRFIVSYIMPTEHFAAVAGFLTLASKNDAHWMRNLSAAVAPAPRGLKPK